MAGVRFMIIRAIAVIDIVSYSYLITRENILGSNLCTCGKEADEGSRTRRHNPH